MDWEVKVKLRRAKLLTLYGRYRGMCQEYVPANGHEQLLQLHIIEMYEKLGRLARRGNERNTLSLTATQATAFMQLWLEKSVGDYHAGTVVNALIAAIDQYRNSPQRIIPDIA